MDHKIYKCQHCGGILLQCRCPGPHQTVFVKPLADHVCVDSPMKPNGAEFARDEMDWLVTLKEISRQSNRDILLCAIDAIRVAEERVWEEARKALRSMADQAGYVDEAEILRNAAHCLKEEAHRAKSPAPQREGESHGNV